MSLITELAKLAKQRNVRVQLDVMLKNDEVTVRTQFLYDVDEIDDILQPFFVKGSIEDIQEKWSEGMRTAYSGTSNEHDKLSLYLKSYKDALEKAKELAESKKTTGTKSTAKKTTAAKKNEEPILELK